MNFESEISYFANDFIIYLFTLFSSVRSWQKKEKVFLEMTKESVIVEARGRNILVVVW